MWSIDGRVCTSRKSTETGQGVPWVCTRLGPSVAAAERSWAWLPSETRCVHAAVALSSRWMSVLVPISRRMRTRL